MLKASVENFFDATEFGPPEIAHIVEALVDRVQTSIDDIELCVHGGELGADKRQHQTDQRGVEYDRDSDGEIELLIRHQD